MSSPNHAPGASALIFNIDLAGPVDAPPVLFHAMRAPCACGRALVDNTYTFFPSAVFVHGTCSTCGPQTAIFAPEMRGVGEPLSANIARTMARLTSDLARTYGASPQDVLAEFLQYLADIDADTGTKSATS